MKSFKLLISLLATLWLGQLWADGPSESIRHFSGNAPGGTEAFQIDGPWLLSWTAASDFPQIAFMEIHLYDAQTDRFLGLIAQSDGPGKDQRLIRESGTFRIVVTGSNMRWSLEVEPAEATLAELVRSRPDLERIQLIEPRTGVATDLVRNAKGWRAEGETAIWLTGSGDPVRIAFHGGIACPGLQESPTISFVTSGFDTQIFNAILLENGTRCYLDTPISEAVLEN